MIEGDRVIGVEAGGRRVVLRAAMTVVAGGRRVPVARDVGGRSGRLHKLLGFLVNSHVCRDP